LGGWMMAGTEFRRNDDERLQINQLVSQSINQIHLSIHPSIHQNSGCRLPLAAAAAAAAG